MARICVTVFLTFISSFSSFSQTWQWAKNAGGATLDYGNAIAVDALGNSYVTGYFYGTATFQSTTVTSFGYGDVFIAKYTSGGNLVWLRKAGSAGGNDYGYGIAFDGMGNIFLTGRFDASATFGTYTLTSAGNSDIFIAKYDTSGNAVWAVSAGALGNDAGKSICVDLAGNCYIAGYFNYGNGSNPLIIGNDTLSSAGGIAFVAKYNSLGTPVWGKRVVDTGISPWQYPKICLGSSGTFYYTSQFVETATVGNDTLICPSCVSTFIAKCDTGGNSIWAKKIPFTGGPCLYSLKADTIGNIYTTGEYIGTGILGSDTIINSTAYGAFYIAKYNSNGIGLWGKTAIGNDGSIGEDISIDNYGNCYIAGIFADTVIFGSNSLISAGNKDIFIAKYNSSGNFLWVKQAGGIDYEIGNSIAIDVNGNSYLAGTFYCGFPIFGSTTLSCNGISDIFIAKLNDILTKIEIPYYTNNDFIIYPNPAIDEIHVLTNESGLIEIYTVLGEMILAFSFANHSVIDCSALRQGVYFYKIKVKEQIIQSDRLVIVK